MRGAIHLTAVLLLAALASGCAMSVDVDFDEREDLSKYRTWGWLPRQDPRVEVSHGSAAALDGKLARLIEQRLVANGFRRSAGRPDFYVTYQLAVVRHRVEVTEPRAIYELSSMHSSPSYVIERSDKATHSYAATRLAIGAMRPGGGTLWHATFHQNERERHAVKLDDAVAMLLERFPHHHPGKAEAEQRRRAICAGELPETEAPRDAVEETAEDGPQVEAPPGIACPERGPDRRRDRPRSGRNLPA